MARREIFTQVGGTSVVAITTRRVKGDVGLAVIAGRVPAAPDEVMLGGKTMRRLHVGLGDSVDVGGARMRVVGQTLLPVDEVNRPIAEGVAFETDAIERLGIDVLTESERVEYLVDLADGVEVARAEERLSAVMNGSAPTASGRAVEVDQLRQVRTLPEWLMAIIALMAFVSVGNALVATVRRRRGELAVLRCLGLTRRQTSRTIAWQAATIAAVGALAGLPLGVIVGRTVWHALATSYAIGSSVVIPGAAVALVVPVAVAISLALSWWPGRRAAGLHPAEILRSE
jgi:predicted lysophospholipase L1 biosynthesis ABC-type transport system permease subunit